MEDELTQTLNYGVAFAMSIVGSLSSILGGAILLCVPKYNAATLAVSVSFCAGVMLYISFIELYTESVSYLTATHEESGETLSMIYTTIGLLSLAPNVSV